MNDRLTASAPASMPRWQVVEAAGVAATPWRNGGGMTRELLRLPGPSSAQDASDGDWMMRVSVADIAADGPFSAFAGIERWFAVLSGAGVALSRAGAAPPGDAASSSRVDVVTPADEPLCFEGDRPPACRLLDGPTRDLNVMCRRDLARAGMARAQWRRAWHPQDAVTGSRLLGAGLFAAVPLLLRTGAGPDRLLPAQTLAWCELPDLSTWTIVPAGQGVAAKAQTAPDGAPPGWWIALSPVQLPAC